ncbi:MAG: hypothetical protein AAFP84_02445 [Actinomycetota bacterium]
MAAQPAIDLTDVDLVPAFRRASHVTNVAAKRASGLATKVAKETTYTAVGLGLLTWQRLQVRRRELERALRD